jgi:hypothetical protein
MATYSAMQMVKGDITFIDNDETQYPPANLRRRFSTEWVIKTQPSFKTTPFPMLMQSSSTLQRRASEKAEEQLVGYAAKLKLTSGCRVLAIASAVANSYGMLPLSAVLPY